MRHREAGVWLRRDGFLLFAGFSVSLWFKFLPDGPALTVYHIRYMLPNAVIARCKKRLRDYDDVVKTAQTKKDKGGTTDGR